MKAKILLLVVAFLLAAFAIFLRGKLKAGEVKLRAGRQKLAKYDNWFVGLFFSDQLYAGRKQLSDGEKKLSLWKVIFVLSIIICIACIVAAIKIRR